jgi:hypothetical protein
MAAALELGEPFSKGEQDRIARRLGQLPPLSPDLVAGSYRVAAKHMPNNSEHREVSLTFTRRPDGRYDVRREVSKSGVILDARSGIGRVLDPSLRTNSERGDMVRVLDVEFEGAPAYGDTIHFRTRDDERRGAEEPLILRGRYAITPWGRISVRFLAKASARPVRGDGWRAGGPLGTFSVNPWSNWKARTVHDLLDKVESGVTELAANHPERLPQFRAAVVQRLLDAGKLSEDTDAPRDPARGVLQALGERP